MNNKIEYSNLTASGRGFGALAKSLTLTMLPMREIWPVRMHGTAELQC